MPGPSRRVPVRCLTAVCLSVVLAGCIPAAPVSRAPAEPDPRTAAPAPTPEGFIGQGMASWYGPNFRGRPTANGEIFDPSRLTAAHRTLPFGTRVRVTHLATGRSVVVRINDRGPFKDDRIIDLSRAAAARIGLTDDGVARVRLEYAGSEGGPRALVAAGRLTGYDVIAPGVEAGTLLVLRKDGAADVVVRVVDVPPPTGPDLAGSELFAAPSLAERLGPVVDVAGL